MCDFFPLALFLFGPQNPLELENSAYKPVFRLPCVAKPLSEVAFTARVNKSFANHLDMAAFVDANLFAAEAFYFVALCFIIVLSCDATFVAAQHLPFANFVIFPQLSFTTRTFD